MITLKEMPRCTPAMAERIERILAERKGCAGQWGCEDTTASVRRRFVAGNEAIYLQCRSCGRAIGSSLSKKEFAYLCELEEWDDDLAEDTAERAKEERAQRQAEHEAWKADSAGRRDRYAAWLWTSHEWHTIRKRVLRRAHFQCECCLDADATIVHHETYDLGVLPPAWLLKAVCRACHHSLHNFQPTTV